MTRRTRGLVVTLLVLAALVGASTALLSNLLISYSVDELPREGITVRYALVNPAVPSFIIGLPRPTVTVVDEGGKPIAGVLISMYAALPKAKVVFLGRISGRGNALELRSGLVTSLRERIVPAWRSVLGGVEGFRASVLAFIDVLVPLENNRFEVYSFVKTIPINLGLLSRGYNIASIKVTVNTAIVKPNEVLDLSKVRATPTVYVGQRNLSTEGPSDCMQFCADGVCSCFCTEWRLEKTYAHIEDKIIPIVTIRVPQKYYTTPQAVSTIYESFAFKDSEVSWFRLYAAARVTGDPHAELMDWESYTKFNFFYSKIFYNSRWLSDKPSFRDDVIVAIGLKASATLGEFRKYEATCECSFCSDSDYHPTDTTANITFIDISAKYTGSGWEATSYGYIIDDSLGDGKGLERFWNLMTSHSEVGDVRSGAGEARYQFQGYVNREVDMGVDVVDLLSLFIGGGVSKLAKYFPVNAGIGWGNGEKTSNIIEIYVKNYYKYSDYYIFLTNYVCKDKVFIGDEGVRLKLMHFDADIYPPSGV